MTCFDEMLPCFGDIAGEICFFKLLREEGVVVGHGPVEGGQMKGLEEVGMEEIAVEQIQGNDLKQVDHHRFQLTDNGEGWTSGRIHLTFRGNCRNFTMNDSTHLGLILLLVFTLAAIIGLQDLSQKSIDRAF